MSHYTKSQTQGHSISDNQPEPEDNTDQILTQELVFGIRLLKDEIKVSFEKPLSLTLVNLDKLTSMCSSIVNNRLIADGYIHPLSEDT